jgi:hypothetical protein
LIKFFQIVVAWLMKRLSPRIARKPTEALRASSPDGNQKGCAVDPHAEDAGAASEGQLKVDAVASSVTTDQLVPIFEDGGCEAPDFEQRPQPSAAIEAPPCGGEGPSGNPETAKEEATAGQGLRAKKEEPATEETRRAAIGAALEAEGGAACPAPAASGLPLERNGVGIGAGAAVETPTAIAEEQAEAVASEGGETIYAKQQAAPVSQDGGGTALVSGGGATGLEPSRPKKAEVLESERETPSETESGDPGAARPPCGALLEGNGVEIGPGAALETAKSSPVTEEPAVMVQAEGSEAILPNQPSPPADHDGDGKVLVNGGDATGLNPAGPKKAPVLESEWEAYSERPGGGPSKPQPATRAKTEKEAEAAVRITKKATESDSEGSEPEKRSPEPIDISEYNGQGVASLPDSYLWWNRILLQRFVTVAASGEILLATTPRALAAALFDDKDERVTPPEAEKKFADAVAAAYKASVMGSAARLKLFRRLVSANGIPMCVAFLALSVLAAHKMHTDETTWSSDYYSRLAELLGVEEGANGQPVGFRTDEFESLWLFLADWISKKTGCSLVLPQGSAQKRFIAYPFTHVPLRQLDLEKLPDFFEWAGYSSEIAPSPERLEDDLRRWDEIYGSFSNAGQQALNDSRVGAVLTQVRSELRAWDGVVSDLKGVRYSQVEILLETIGRQSSLALLARRREGFPETFSCGDVQLSGGDSWYDPLLLKPGDGALLLEGFSWPAEDRLSCVLRRAPGLVSVLAPHADYSDLVSRTGLPKDITCAVLCHESLLAAAGFYLTSICQAAPRHFHNGSLPDGWFLFLGVRAIRRAESVPEELRALEVATEANIIPCGGLRMGAQWAWLEGAAPRLLIEGHDGQPVSVNDMPVDLDEDGYIKPAETFANAGEYTVRIGSFERKVRILKPRLRPGTTPVLPVDGTQKAQHSVIVEAGHWSLIGSFPGEIETVEARGLGSTLIFCDFEPVWAVKLGARKSGTRAIELVRKPVEISVTELLKTRAQAIRRIKKRAAAHRWACAIRAVDCRQPDVESGSENQHEGPDERWAQYVQIARVIKRLSKRGLL